VSQPGSNAGLATYVIAAANRSSAMNPNEFDRRSFLCGASAASLIAGGVAGLDRRTASAEQTDDPFADLFYILVDKTSTMLTVLDNEVWFRDFLKWSKETYQTYEPVLKTFRQELTVKSKTTVWRYRNNHIRAYYPREDRVAGRYVPGPEGGYLTADYSTIPPRVVLTREANEWSRWEVIPVESARVMSVDPRAGIKYVRHLNGRQQDAWLVMSKNEFVRDQPLVSVMQPTLSLDHKIPLYFRSYFPDDTSK
jgi:hypothetical protein